MCLLCRQHLHPLTATCTACAAPHSPCTASLYCRPTMILYSVDNIRDLFGHKVSLQMVKKNSICRLGL